MAVPQRTMAATFFAVLAGATPALGSNHTPSPPPPFEFQLGGGYEYGPFAKIGRFGETTANLPLSREVVNGDLSGNFFLLQGHTLLRTNGSVPGIDGIRFDARYRDGSASRSDAYSRSSIYSFLVPTVDATELAGTGATSVNVNTRVKQDASDLALALTLVRQAQAGNTQFSSRFGPSFLHLRQSQSIDIALTQLVGGNSEFDTQTSGSLRTNAFGMLAALEARHTLNHAITLVASLEGTLEQARTRYQGDSARTIFGNIPLAHVSAADSRSHLMTNVLFSGGVEINLFPGATFTLLGDARWQGGAPHVVYPRIGHNNFGDPILLTSGPAHIGLEDRTFYGVRAALRIRR